MDWLVNQPRAAHRAQLALKPRVLAKAEAAAAVAAVIVVTAAVGIEQEAKRPQHRLRFHGRRDRRRCGERAGDVHLCARVSE